jgi:hypothetical protein
VDFYKLLEVASITVVKKRALKEGSKKWRPSLQHAWIDAPLANQGSGKQ